MGRKSSIEKLQPAVRSFIERSLRENRLTLDELIEQLQERFPGERKPSRSAIGRYSQGFTEMTKRLREQQAMASALVEELGENPDDKAGALMVQSITTLTNHVSMAVQDDPNVTVDDVRKLARAAKDVLQARKVSREERRAIEKEAREKLLQEQEQRLEEMRGSDGMSEQLENRIRGILLGKV